VKRLLWIVLVAACSTSSARPPPAKTADVRAAAHQMLVRRCGECHERHRKTAVPKALAAFDLDTVDWPARFADRKRAEAAMRRLAAAPASDTAAFIALRDALRSGS
jgi:cytochrome c553